MTVVEERVPTLVDESTAMRMYGQPLPGAEYVSAKILSADRGEVAGVLLVEPDGSIEPHVHEHDDHHMYVLEGRCWFGGTPLVEGDYLRAPAGVTHSLRGGGPSGCRLLYVASGVALDTPLTCALHS